MIMEKSLTMAIAATVGLRFIALLRTPEVPWFDVLPWSPTVIPVSIVAETGVVGPMTPAGAAVVGGTRGGEVAATGRRGGSATVAVVVLTLIEAL